MKARTLLPVVGALLMFGLAMQARAEEQCAGRPEGASRLVVQTTGLKTTAGEVAVTVYPDDPRRFMAPRGKLLRLRVPAAQPATHACFWLPAGAYAIAIYHDANRNRDFDRNPVGIPIEGFGFSNDAPTKFGLPSFDAVRFHLPMAGAILKIRMRYAR